MGKALIVSSTGEGLYRAKLQPDRSAYDRHHARLTAAIARVADLLATLAPQISSAESAEAAAYTLLQNGIVNQSEKVKEYEAAWLKANTSLQGLYQNRARLTLQKAAFALKLSELESSAPQDTVEVDLWCADYSDDLAGTVGTIEPAGDSDLGIIIRPGQRAPAWTAADGTLRDARHMSASEVFTNAALLPGWQTWAPTYRVGTITALTGNTCAVLLDPVASEAQGLNVNQAPALVDVAIDYMDCHGAAFAVDDRVIVMFQGQEWGNPQVIGFASNPKPCTLRGIAFFDGLESAAATGQPFNVLEYKETAWNKKSPAGKNGLLAGNINWTNGEKTLSWWGVSRYFSTIATVDATLRETIDTGGMMFTAGMGSQVVKGQIYCLKEWDGSAPADGFYASIKLVTSVSSQMGGPYVDELTGMTVSGEDIYGGYGEFSTVDLGSIDNILYCEGKAYLLPPEMGDRVNGAAFAVIGEVTKLIIVCREDYDPTGHNRSIRNTRESVWVATLGEAGITDPVKIATYTYASTPFFNLSPWLFSANGKSAVCHRMAGGVNDPKLCRIEIDDTLETVEFFDDGYYFTGTNTYGYPNIHVEAVEVIRDYKGNTLTAGELRSESTFLEEDYQHPDPSNAVTGDISNSHTLTYVGGAFNIVFDGIAAKTVLQSTSSMQRVDSYYLREYGFGGEGGSNGFNSIMQSTLSASGVTTRHVFLNDIDLRDGYVNIETLELAHGEDSYTRFTTNQTFPLPILPPAPPTAGFGGAITCTAIHEAFTPAHVLFSETVNATIAAVPDSEAVLPFRSGRYGLQFTTYSRVSPLSLQSGSVCFENIAFSGIPGTSPGGVFVNHSYVNCDIGRGRLPHFARNWRQMDVQMASTSAFEPGGKRLVVGPKLANARAQIIRYGTGQPNWTQAGAERIGVLQGGDLSQFAAAIVSLPTKV